MTDRLLSVREACALLGISRSTLYKYIFEGTGPRSVHVGKRRLFRRSDLDAWIASLTDSEAA